MGLHGPRRVHTDSDRPHFSAVRCAPVRVQLHLEALEQCDAYALHSERILGRTGGRIFALDVLAHRTGRIRASAAFFLDRSGHGRRQRNRGLLDLHVARGVLRGFPAGSGPLHLASGAAGKPGAPVDTARRLPHGLSPLRRWPRAESAAPELLDDHPPPDVVPRVCCGVAAVCLRRGRVAAAGGRELDASRVALVRLRNGHPGNRDSDGRSLGLRSSELWGILGLGSGRKLQPGALAGDGGGCPLARHQPQQAGADGLVQYDLLPDSGVFARALQHVLDQKRHPR